MWNTRRNNSFEGKARGYRNSLKTIRQVTTKITQQVGRETKVAQSIKKRIVRDRVKDFREVKNAAQIDLFDLRVFSQCYVTAEYGEFGKQSSQRGL